MKKYSSTVLAPITLSLVRIFLPVFPESVGKMITWSVLAAIYAFPAVIVHPVTEHVRPIDMVAVLRIKSVAAVPALPSITNVPPDVVTRNHVAVPAANPVVFAGSVGDNTPAADAGANGVPSVNSASFVVAAPPVAGLAPSYICSLPALPTLVV
jgi:hypothetical protein